MNWKKLITFLFFTQVDKLVSANEKVENCYGNILFEKKNFLLHLNLRIYIDNTLTKYLYLYNLHCYNAPLISIELQTEKWQITSICKGLLSKHLQQVSLFVRLFLVFLFNQKGQRSTILQAQKTHKVIYFMCVFQINVRTKYTDLKIKPKYVQVCVSVYCHFTNVLRRPFQVRWMELRRAYATALDIQYIHFQIL